MLETTRTTASTTYVSPSAAALGTIPMHGRIALQGVHGGKAVHFKYLKVKEL